MIDSFFLAVQQPFFIRSLIVVAILACVFPLYGNIVVVRQEANIAHTFAHIGLLGVAVGLLLDIDIHLSILVSICISVILIYIIGSQKSSHHVAHNEILAQFGLVGAILIVSSMSGYSADISSYLFGDILLLGRQDIYVIALLCGLAGLLYRICGKSRYALSLDRHIAMSKGISNNVSYILYLVGLGLLIGGAMKIIGVLLVSAFLILPSNISKIWAYSKASRSRGGVSIGIVCSISALFMSWHLNIPSGSTIIACMLVIYVLMRIIKSLA